MISKEDRERLCELVDEMRMRGVQIIHIERDNLKLEFHVTAISAEAAVSAAVKTRMLNDPNTPEEIKRQLRQEEDDEEAHDDITGAG